MPQPPAVPALARPDSVRQAATLLFVSVGLSILGTLYSFAFVGVNRFLSAPTFLLTPFLLILWVVFTIFVLQRQNWARVGIAILMLWSATLVLNTFLILSHGGRFSSLALPWVGFFLRLAACYLLFTPASNAWFNSAGQSPALPNQSVR
ncbi:MAG TPA: hypothetical protein VEU96_06835 [Bryobacteraceae bacterium]|nr:hypothetical protein [Bryobacteraceae bacterium]